MLDKKIIEILKPLRLKFYFSRLLMYFSYSLLGFSMALLVLMILSKIVPIPFIWTKIAITFITCLIIGVLWSIYKIPSYYETAKLIDGFGLNERTITALELKGDNSKLAELQKRDALNNLTKENLKKKIYMKPSKKLVILTVVMILSSILVGFINTKSSQLALIKEKNKELINEEIENIEKVEKNLKEDDQLSMEEKEQIEKLIEEAKRELEMSENTKDISKIALKTKKELERIENEIKQEKIADIVNKFADNQFTKELAESLKNKDAGKLRESIEKMAEQLKNIDKEQLSNLANEMSKLAEQFKDNKVLNEALRQLSESMSQSIEGNMNNGNILNELNDLSESLLDLMNDYQVSEAISQLNESLENLSNVEQNFQGNNNSNGQPNTSGSGNNSQGNDSQNGNGQGNGQVQGSGEGEGNGAGEGSSSGNENSTNNSSGQSGNKEGSEKIVKDYESIFTPKNIDSNGENSQVHGEINNSGDKDIIQIKKFGDIKGESMPYKEVLNIYKQNAYKRLENDNIPPNMKEIIRKYFSDLE